MVKRALPLAGLLVMSCGLELTGLLSGAGSGGMIFLEAPAITINGTLASNGGGGGGAAHQSFGVGQDAAGVTAPSSPSTGTGNGGGGGGAANRIYLGTRGAQLVKGGTSVITPTPSTDTTL